MTVQEFSNQFDTEIAAFINLHKFEDNESLDSLEFDEYEKSVFLTKSQEELVLSLYNGRNPSLQSFEETEELRRYLSNLIEEVELDPITTTDGNPLGMESSSKFFTLPDGTEDYPAVWFITYESVNISNDNCPSMTSLEVVPVTQDEYRRIRKNPFRGANDRRALRLDLSENNIEIVSKYTVTKYYARYLRKPSPIVLEDMPDGVTIDGIGEETPCKLHSALHQKILNRAVSMALASKGYNINKENK